MPEVKAVGYIRVSGQSQVENDGPIRQREAILGYAKAHGIKVVKIYEDLGVSGTLQNRPGLGALMLELEENGVRDIIIERMDRLARDLLVSEFLISSFKNKGFTLHSAHEGSDLLDEDPTRVMIRQILGSVAQFNKACLVLKLRAARDRVRAKHGQCEGPKLRDEDRKLRLRILDMRDKQGISETRIADIFNKEGLKTRQGKPYSRAVIANTIRRAV